MTHQSDPLTDALDSFEPRSRDATAIGAQGRRMQTRPVGSIDRGVSLNRALWVLAEEMRKIKR